MKGAMLGRVLGRGARGFATKPKCVMLNSARLDFDGRMDWSKAGEGADLKAF